MFFTTNDLSYLLKNLFQNQPIFLLAGSNLESLQSMGFTKENLLSFLIIETPFHILIHISFIFEFYYIFLHLFFELKLPDLSKVTVAKVIENISFLINKFSFICSAGLGIDTIWPII